MNILMSYEEFLALASCQLEQELKPILVRQMQNEHVSLQEPDIDMLVSDYAHNYWVDYINLFQQLEQLPTKEDACSKLVEKIDFMNCRACQDIEGYSIAYILETLSPTQEMSLLDKALSNVMQEVYAILNGQREPWSHEQIVQIASEIGVQYDQLPERCQYMARPALNQVVRTLEYMVDISAHEGALAPDSSSEVYVTPSEPKRITCWRKTVPIGSASESSC